MPPTESNQNLQDPPAFEPAEDVFRLASPFFARWHRQQNQQLRNPARCTARPWRLSQSGDLPKRRPGVVIPHAMARRNVVGRIYELHAMHLMADAGRAESAALSG